MGKLLNGGIGYMYSIGIDLGGTNIATAVVDENYKIIGKGHLPTNAPRDGYEVAKDMIRTAETACADAGITMADISWIGVGTPGAVNPDNGVIETAANLGFYGVPMKKYVEELSGKLCFIENDANAAACGEYIAGAGKSYKHLVAITLGTGVGGGVIIDGKIFSGSNGYGAELGHEVIIMDGEPCTCGRNGCWEAYASATALIRQTKRAMMDHSESKMWEIAGSLENVNGKTAFDGMRAEDPAAKAVCDKYIEYVGCGIVNMINIFQPEILCIGGGISKEKDNLTVPIREYVERNVFTRKTDKRTVITTAQLGNDAGIIGAATLGYLAQ